MENMIQNMNTILNGLNIKAECINANQHRHLAHYDLKLSPGAKIREIESSSGEMALGLRCKTMPIIDVIPEEGIVRVKVAQRDADVLNFEELYKKSNPPNCSLPFLLGETDTGEPLWVDMTQNPHMLIAGTTGSGKSTLLHVMIVNALKRKDISLCLIDPKQGVEFSKYSGQAIIVTNYNKTIEILEHYHNTMESRYQYMSEQRFVSIEQIKYMNKILIIIDEVSDLMLSDSDKNNPHKGELEKLLISMAQKARAAGIHLVVATQRPSVDVLTGILKANFPARIACKVSSATDSKVILDKCGAESLLGKGDAIINAGKFNYVRFQSAYI